MKNKYYLANKREARMTSLNTWIMTKFTAPMRAPRMLLRGVIRLVKLVINTKENMSYNRTPVYESLEIPESCFKSSRTSRNIVRSF